MTISTHSIPTRIHGRYLVAAPADGSSAPLLVGFHGYGEDADVQMERLQRIPSVDAWTVVSVQGLHRFYRPRSNDVVVASWMTRQDRELAIADNLAYVAAVVDAVLTGAAPRTIVFAGFSQGVATAFRAAAASSRPVAGVIAVGGDVPPELDDAALGGIGAALVCHGETDPFYKPPVFESDLQRLRTANVRVTPLAFEGGHEWSDEVAQAAASFLKERRRD